MGASWCCGLPGVKGDGQQREAKSCLRSVSLLAQACVEEGRSGRRRQAKGLAQKGTAEVVVVCWTATMRLGENGLLRRRRRSIEEGGENEWENADERKDVGAPVWLSD